MPPDVVWLGAVAGCGGWLGGAMDGWLGVVELLLPVPLEVLPLPLGLLLLLLGLLLPTVPLLGDVVASAG